MSSRTRISVLIFCVTFGISFTICRILGIGDSHPPRETQLDRIEKQLTRIEEQTKEKK